MCICSRSAAALPEAPGPRPSARSAPRGTRDQPAPRLWLHLPAQPFCRIQVSGHSDPLGQSCGPSAVAREPANKLTAFPHLPGIGAHPARARVGAAPSVGTPLGGTPESYALGAATTGRDPGRLCRARRPGGGAWMAPCGWPGPAGGCADTGRAWGWRLGKVRTSVDVVGQGGQDELRSEKMLTGPSKPTPAAPPAPCPGHLWASAAARLAAHNSRHLGPSALPCPSHVQSWYLQSLSHCSLRDSG